MSLNLYEIGFNGVKMLSIHRHGFILTLWCDQLNANQVIVDGIWF